MLKKLLVALVASAFALGAYAQAPKSDAKGDTKAAAKKSDKAKAKAKDGKATAGAKKDEKAKK
ncbi:MAG TPA: hypothetical protein VJQ58_04930 [Burkholderiales bacterium]|nr:hypothetical protein [Burkholderiales bacterium]